MTITRKKKPKKHTEKEARVSLCKARQPLPRVFTPNASDARIRAITETGKLWNNGSLLRYYFYNKDTDGEYVERPDGSVVFVKWRGTRREKNIIREAFDIWKSVGIGLEFEEVDDRTEAEIRIGFMDGDGHWSYIGRDVLAFGPNVRTMNFDTDLRDPGGVDTALHEIGHTLGLHHAHQNPFAGIVWDKEAVYQSLGGYPNFWDRETTDFNILNKLSPGTVKGTEWDRDSIMQYPFEAGLILEPEEYRDAPLYPAPGLSPLGKRWIQRTYPPQDAIDRLPRLRQFESLLLNLKNGEQADAVFVPDGTQEFSISTFGETDLVITVFEMIDDRPQFLMGEDDGGQDINASLRLRMIKGRTYVIRSRLYYNGSGGDYCIMIH